MMCHKRMDFSDGQLATRTLQEEPRNNVPAFASLRAGWARLARKARKAIILRCIHPSRPTSRLARLAVRKAPPAGPHTVAAERGFLENS